MGSGPDFKILKKQIWRYYQMPFRALVVGIRNFKKNRDWVDRIMARPKMTAIWKALIYITVLGWLVMALMMEASERDVIAEFMEMVGFK